MPETKKTLKILLIPGGGEEWSLKRVNLAVEASLHESVDMIIFTGGKMVSVNCSQEGKADEQVVRSEAELMRYEYQRLTGNDATRILLETEARDTFENIRFSLAKLIDEFSRTGEYVQYKCASITIASDGDHVKRFKISWDPIRRKKWSLSLRVKPTFVALCGQRSRKEHRLELFFRLIHFLSPTGKNRPVSWFLRWNRRRISAKVVE